MFLPESLEVLSTFGAESGNRPLCISAAHSDWNASGTTLPVDTNYYDLGDYLPFTAAFNNNPFIRIDNATGRIYIKRRAAIAALIFVSVGGRKTGTEANPIIRLMASGGVSGRCGFAKFAGTGGFNVSTVGMCNIGSSNVADQEEIEISVQMSAANCSGVKPQFFNIAVIVF